MRWIPIVIYALRLAVWALRNYEELRRLVNDAPDTLATLTRSLRDLRLTEEERREIARKYEDIIHRWERLREKLPSMAERNPGMGGLR